MQRLFEDFRKFLRKIWNFLFPHYKINNLDLQNQSIYLEAERLNYERGRKFCLEAFKFSSTLIGVLITILAFIHQLGRDSYNTQNSQFIELSSRASSTNPRIAANAIAMFPLFSTVQIPWYLKGFVKESQYPYLEQIRNLLIERLHIEALETKKGSIETSIVESACVNSLSQINRNLVKEDKQLDLSYQDSSKTRLNNIYLTKADLSYSKLISSNLSNSTLKEVILRDADLRSVDFSHSDLSHVIFSKIYFSFWQAIETLDFNIYKRIEERMPDSNSFESYKEAFHIANLEKSNFSYSTMGNVDFSYTHLPTSVAEM